MKKIIGLRTVKTAVGASISIIIAEFFGLKYAAAAGVITILSLQNTKKASITIAFQRICSTVLALFISSILFVILGYNAVTFGVYLIIFIPAAVYLKLTDGIVVSSVLVTHLLVEKSIALFWMKNEMLLMAIGAGSAILLNFYMPNTEKKIKNIQKEIEELIKKILLNMAYTLRNKAVNIEEEKMFRNLEDKLREGSELAYRNVNNYILNDAKYYLKYMEMRKLQFDILKYMRKHFTKFYMTFDQTELVANVTEKIAAELQEYNRGYALIEELNKLLKEFKLQGLPKTREEFENRAMLYQFLNDLEYFLEIKINFAEDMLEKDSDKA
ncbi:aromatic acid exporter family protein [Clostridium sp. 19966]|uniref:aromatic acid exporter family protein n=1 Tax=Clostridium sp. 19966 TaxID=2768166 RepID=UPI0028DD4E1D|nr:aromatic acid exporter family protein [Clostridium sp. 19966]MDT8716720.1 aromatic acid exporter family protein [Clostridium sp. 19966]